MLRRLMQHGYVNQLWRAARDTPESDGLACPLCHNAMRVVQNLPDDSGDSLHVDVCTSCHSVWFDTHEMDTLLEHVARPPEPAKPELSPKAREILALARIEQIREQADRECPEGALPPADGWQAILTVFGFPVEENAPAISRWPWVTLLLMTLATAWVTWGDPAAIAHWGFLPSDPLRHGGLPLITGFFLHAGWIHLIGNAFFLAIFGDNVEDFLGHGRFLLLLLGASLAGDLLHMAWEPRDTLPLVGASGGISGVIVFYALQFPKARLVYFVRVGFFFRWVRFSALTGLACWVVIQSLGVWQQVSGLSPISDALMC